MTPPCPLVRPSRPAGKPGGRLGLTVDHLVPQSRGGGHTWENLAACCSPCNHRKADRTPEEAGMCLRWTPWRPNAAEVVQRQVWKALVTT